MTVAQAAERSRDRAWERRILVRDCDGSDGANQVERRSVLEGSKEWKGGHGL